VEKETDMALLTWNDAYSVNVKEMDDQHKKLLEMINLLHDAMKVGQGKDIVGKVLGGLTDYTRRHFTAEENLMKIHGYTGYEEQKKAHDSMVSLVVEMKNKYDSGHVHSQQVITFLKDWLLRHIQGMDQQYGPYLNGKGIK
jgi:hemerythrin